MRHGLQHRRVDWTAGNVPAKSFGVREVVSGLSARFSLLQGYWEIGYLERLLLVLVASNAWTAASGQAFYESTPQRFMYSPTQGDDEHIFAINPAVSPTTNRKLSGYTLRHQSETTFTGTDDAKTTTKTSLTEEAYGAGVLFDLGAGAAAGVSLERSFAKSDLTVSSVTRVPYEQMASQTVSGKILVDLAPGLRAGLVLRWMTERGDILGNSNANTITGRIPYTGTLIGHGGGGSFSIDKFRAGAAYFPPARGKGDVLFEQKIMTEPGFATADITYNFDKNRLGLGIERALHRRDERAGSVLSEDGSRNVTLDGISPNKNFFETQAIHLGGDAAINSQWGVRGDIAQRTREFVFDDVSIPSGNGDQASYLDITVAAKLLTPMGVIAGYKFSNFATTLTSKSGGSRAGSTFKGSEKVLFLSLGAKF